MGADDFPILGIDYVHLYVESAVKSVQNLSHLFGFDEVAYAGPETGCHSALSHMLTQGNARLVVTSSCENEKVTSHIWRHVARHGDGVKDIALRVMSVEAAYRKAIERGARPVHGPIVLWDEHGMVRRAAIHTYGDTFHSFVERHEYHGPFMPGYREVGVVQSRNMGLQAIDHIVGNVELGQMNTWAQFYADVMGFSNRVHFTDSQISTEYSALMSKVMEDGSGNIKFPINEPAIGKKGRSQIQEYLDVYQGPGVQHIAFATGNIIMTVSEMRAHGVKFLNIPQTYYDDVRTRFADVPEVDIDMLARLGILVDRDEDGFLFQIFTKHVVDRPTLFFEIIERRGSRGFGLGNFKALFEAIERDQRARGAL